MYPEHELTRLAVHQANLRGRIAAGRTQCAADATKLVRPLILLDRVVDFWRRLSPLVRMAVVPVGFIVQRAIFRRRHGGRSGLRWRPLIFGALRVIRLIVGMRRRLVDSS